MMRALVLQDRAVRLEERPVPVPGPTEVVVRTTAASICSADVAGVAGDFAVADGTILGHEAVGVVHSIGSAVRRIREGMRVAVPANTPCGQCDNCQRGFDGHCGGVDWGGYTSGVTRDGSLAEFFTVAHADFNCTPVPDEVTDEAAVCVCDTLASGITGPEMARVPLGGTVAVFGQGHIGLAAVAGARLLGAALVIGVKARAGGSDVSAAMGADHVLNRQEHDVLARIRALTDGLGVDCAVDASGVRESFPVAVAATRTGGTISVLSSYAGPPDAALAIPLAEWGWGVGDKTVLSVMQRSGSARLSRLLRLVAAGRLDPSPLVTHHYSFDQVDRAFHDLATRSPGLIKPVITF